jgi:hypothetical protein
MITNYGCSINGLRLARGGDRGRQSLVLKMKDLAEVSPFAAAEMYQCLYLKIASSYQVGE